MLDQLARWLTMPAYLRVEQACLVALFLLLWWMRRPLMLASVKHPYLLLAGLTITLRLSLLPLFPVPDPRFHDEFSYLLGADTFAHGRLANPTHPMWRHFESFHIFHQPTYQSKYPPGQALMLAVGVLLGHPWIAVLASTGAMSAAVAWGVRPWLTPSWALLAGVLVTLRFGLYNYWGNSYWGGTLAAIGGALVLGAAGRGTHPYWYAAGAAVLALRRPWEGLVLFAAVSVVLLPRLTRAHALALAQVMIPVLLWLGYYHYRVTGSAWEWPYMHEAKIYAVMPQFVFLPLRETPPEYRHAVMRDFYTGVEADYFRWRTGNLLLSTATAFAAMARFYLGAALWVAVLAAAALWRERRGRQLILVGIIGVAGTWFVSWPQPHYLAPFTAVVIALVLRGFRHLRAARGTWREAAANAALLTTLVMIFVPPVAGLAGWKQEPNLSGWWSAPNPAWSRLTVEARLAIEEGQHLVLVRASRASGLDYVYNGAGIDAAPVVWARQMSPEQDRELIAYYGGRRRVWLLDAGSDPPKLTGLPP